MRQGNIHDLNLAKKKRSVEKTPAQKLAAKKRREKKKQEEAMNISA